MAVTVSIIIPVHNAGNYIRQTVDSVLAQTYTDYELLLVDDGSTDQSLALLREMRDPRIRVLCNEGPHGASHARNLGLREAGGRYIAYLDADDLWHPAKLERSLALAQRAGAAFVFTAYEFGDAAGHGTGRVVHVPEELDYDHALTRTIIFTSTVLFDTSRIPKEQLAMPQIKSEDTALWWQILRGGVVAHGLDENLVTYRRAGRSLSSNKVEALRRIWGLYRRWEHFGVLRSAWCFCGWAVRAVARRV